MDSNTIDNWRFINSFAPWFSAVGTIAAVLVALYFSRRDKFIKLKIYTGLRVLMGNDFPNNPERITIKITNIGLRKATLNGIGGTVGFFKPIYFQIIPLRNDGISDSLPVTLEEGQSASFYFPIDFFKDLSKKSNRKLLKYTPFKISSYTSIDKTFIYKIEKSCKKKVFETANNYSKT